MHEDDVPQEALLREVVAERFPSWQGVLNEMAWGNYLRQRNWSKLAAIAKAGGPDLIPEWMRDDELSRARRRRDLRAAMGGDYGPPAGRPDDLHEAR